MILHETPFIEAVELIGMINDDSDADQRFNAALHGVDLKASGSSNATGTLRNSHTRMTSRIKQREWRR